MSALSAIAAKRVSSAIAGASDCATGALGGVTLATTGCGAPIDVAPRARPAERSMPANEARLAVFIGDAAGDTAAAAAAALAVGVLEPVVAASAAFGLVVAYEARDADVLACSAAVGRIGGVRAVLAPAAPAAVGETGGGGPPLFS
jgi:hypothetical protein